MQVFAHRLFRLSFGLAAFSAIMYRTTECRNVRYNYPESLVQGVAELLPDHPRLVKAAQQGSPHLGEYLSNLIAFPGGDIGGYYPDDVPALRREYKEKVERRRAKLRSLDLIPQIYQLYLDWFGFLDSLPYKQEDFEKNFGRHFPFKPLGHINTM